MLTCPRLADAPSQAHLQGTQNRHTKANLAKEPALFPCFRVTHLASLDTDVQATHPKEGRTYNMGIAKSRAGRCKLRLCAGISSSSGATKYYFASVFIIVFFIFIQQRFGAGRSMIIPPSAISETLPAMPQNSLIFETQTVRT